LVGNRSVNDRRVDVEDYLRRRILKNAAYVSKSGYIIRDLRELSGTVTYHIRVAKDTYGEISSSLMFLLERLELRHEIGTKISN
jgi:hypothetical protein